MTQQVNFTEERLQALLVSAAALGAKQALEKIGLHDDEAPNDLRDMRRMLDDWRSVKRSMLGAIGKAVGTVAMGALVLWWFATQSVRGGAP